MDATVALVDRLSALLDYPDASFAEALAECRAGAPALGPEAASLLERFAREVAPLSTQALQELYVATFDLDPGTTLDVGWHLFGEAYERGALLADLRQQLQEGRVPEQGELPDHLPLLLRLMPRLDPRRAAELRRRIEPAVEALERALAARESPYGHLIRSLMAAAAPGV